MTDQFNEWLESPITEIFLKYLKDSAKEEAELITERIINGGQVSQEEQIRISTTCITLESISEITLEEIEEFYQEKT